jgi:hypothetical protein
VGLNRQVGPSGGSIRQQGFHGVDGVFADRWGSRIFVDVVFGIFSNRSTQKIEQRIEAPNPGI